MSAAATANWFPLSCAQRSRWFMYELAPEGRGRHNNVFAVRMRGPVAEPSIAQALRQLALRHPMLRARFRIDADEPRQSADFEADVPLQCVDATGWTESVLRDRVAAEALRPFDLAHSPPIRAQLYRCGDGEWVFSLALDHMVSDGWSYWRLLAELGNLLANGADASGQGPGDYHDYVTWQRDWLDGAQAQKQLDRWRDALAGDLPVLALPFAARTPQGESAPSFATLNLSADLVDGLRAMAARNASTLFASLLAAYQILLHRYTGQDDVIVGCPMPARRNGEWDAVVGDFVNVVALRTRLVAQAELGDVLRRVRNSALFGLVNQDYPFSALVERLRVSRPGGEHPVFQAMFAFQKARADGGLHVLWNNASGSAASLHWGSIELAAFPMHQHVGVDGIHLTLQAIEFDRGMRCEFEFDAGQHDASAIERFAASFQVLLESMVSADGREGIDSLPLVTAHERQLLTAFNASDATSTRSALIHQSIQAQVQRTPTAPALVTAGSTLSYEELNRRANRVAHYLRARGVGPDTRVAICAERGVELVVGLLGVLKAGGAYVPLDAHYPPERLEYMLADCAPAVLLTQSWLRDGLPRTDVPVLCLDQAATVLATQPEHDPDPQDLGPEHLAYVIYTSGSTGQPKAAQVTHRGLGNLLDWYLDDLGLGADDAVLLVTSQSFDLTQKNIFGPLLVGGRLHLAAEPFQPSQILRQVRSEAITQLNMAPSAFHALIDSDTGRALSGLKRVVLGGEPIQLAKLRSLPQPRPEFVNSYGPTECSDVVGYHRLGDLDTDYASATVPLGRPIRNLRLYVLDPQGRPSPIGVAGEIHVGGLGVGRGYLGRPELTDERFVADPYAAQAGARMYRTGDLGRYLANGEIEYLGRNDFQVKLRGFRIELGEIESQLTACAGVREAVVIAREDVPGDKRLVAYLVAHEGVELSVAGLREQLSRQLAEYMVPSAFVTLASLPLTANGKLDRTALPAPGLDAVATREYEAPQGAAEQALATIWQELLGVARVGRQDHFFELGGHSLIAVQVAARLRLVLGVEVALRDVFTRPVLADLAAVLGGADQAHAPIARADRDAVLPLSWAQQRLWFLDQLDSAASVAYHMPASLRLSGSLHRPALQAALDRIVARHEVLRTRFQSEEGTPRQVIAAADTGFGLIEQDLSSLEQAARDAAVTQWSVHEANTAFDLTSGPLIRGRLLRLSESEHILLITQHHIISDGWSLGVVVRELLALYTAFSQGEADPLPPLPLQYADYANWQRSHLQGVVLEEQVTYWRDHLVGAPALLELPTDRARPAVQSYKGGSVPIVLSAELTAGLRSLSQRHGTTLFMTLLAGWSVLLSRLSGQQDVVIGTPVANRQRQELEALIGFFVNTLALRVQVDADPSVAQLLAQVKATALDAYAHQDLPFEQVVEAVKPLRSLGHSPIFQSMLAMDSVGDIELTLPGLHVRAHEGAQEVAHFDLTLLLAESDDSLSGRLEFASDLFDEATAARWVGHLQTLFAGMVADEACTVSQLPLLQAHEREQILTTFNATEAPYERERLIHELFEAQAGRDGEAVALECDGQSLSYAELNRRANRVAHYLRARGLRPDDRVAICAERSFEMVVGLLGILKAGGGYVPLDPNYPRERLAYMLADSAPVMLLSQSSLRETLPATDIATLWLDQAPELAQQPEHDPDPKAVGLTSQHLAYVIYTSGSTGQPKGVMVEHRQVANLVHWHGQSFDLRNGSRTSSVAGYGFDAAAWELWSALCGGCVLLLPPSRIHSGDVGGLLAWWQDQDLAVSFLPTPIAEHALAQGLVPASLRTLLVGGDRLHPVTRLLPNLSLINNYGPTETTVVATSGRIEGPGKPLHIGRPIANTQIHIVDAHLQPVPIGVAGELLIGGVQVARGYLNRPELTEQRFIANPFGAAGSRLYRTGDLGRWRADGTIEYLGRNDFQVKLRGFRIELGEIESQLTACAGVREAVVIAREDVPGDKRLVAYLVAHEGVELSVAGLREQLSRQLAEYMVPSAFVTLASLPLTANGKLDRTALPAPGLDLTAARAYEAPLGEVEETIAQLWRELLGVDQVGRNDHFFELGGHSLTFIKLSFGLKERFGTDIKIGQLYELQILKDMAAGVDSHRQRAQRAATGAGTIVLDL